MRNLWIFLLFSSVCFAQQHCGYDFTSHIVMKVHEDGKKENIPGLKLTLVDSLGQNAVNVGNKLSWNEGGKELIFTENYQIDPNAIKPRWHFPFATDVYLLSVTNEFPADKMSVRIEDPKGVYKTELVQLYAYNMYILCTSQAQQQAMQFGPRTNKPVSVVLSK